MNYLCAYNIKNSAVVKEYLTTATGIQGVQNQSVHYHEMVGFNQYNMTNSKWSNLTTLEWKRLFSSVSPTIDKQISSHINTLRF